MVILASFVNDAKDTYVWIRRFEDEADKEARYDAVYNNDYWRDEVAPKLPALMDVDGLQGHHPRGDAALPSCSRGLRRLESRCRTST